MLFESHLWHEEVFPQWVQWLNRLGYFVIIQARAEVIRRDGMEWVPDAHYAYRTWTPDQPLDTSGCDLLVVNTLSGFMHPSIQAYPIERLQTQTLPTICYIHEPLFWMDKYPLWHLEVDNGGGVHRYDLLRDGTFTIDYGPIGQDSWTIENGNLDFFVGGKKYRYELDEENQVTNHPQARLSSPSLGLEEYLAGPGRAALVCTAHSKAYMNHRFPSVDYLFPVYFGDLPASSERRHYRICGEIDFNRKDFESLVMAAPMLRNLKKDHVQILGGNRRSEVVGEHEDERLLRSAIRRNGVEDFISFTGFLEYREFFLKVSQSRFILPLIDRDRDGGSYFNKLTGTVAYALAFAIPMVLDHELAELYGLEFMPTYRNRDLASGLQKAENLSEEAYGLLCDRMVQRRKELEVHNFSVLEALVQKVRAGAWPEQGG